MKSLKIKENLEITSLGAVYFQDKEDYAVIGDLHLGLERYMRQQGVFISKKQLKEIKQVINQLIKTYGKNLHIILNGDIKHDFGKHTAEDKKEIKDLIKYIGERVSELTIIKGNHDNYLVAIADDLGIEVLEYYETPHYFIYHGDKELKINKNKHIIINHYHPSLTLKDDVGAKIKIRCFLIHTNKAIRIVAPAISHYSPGINIIQWEENKKIIDVPLEKYEIYGIEGDEIYHFGKVYELRRLKYI